MTEYYVNITKEELEELDCCCVRLVSNGENDKICIVNNEQYNELKNTLNYISRHQDEVISEKIRNVVQDITSGSVPVNSSNNCFNIINTENSDEGLTYQDIVELINDLNTSQEEFNDSILEINTTLGTNQSTLTTQFQQVNNNISNLSTKTTNLENKIKDSGWKNITIFQSTVKKYSDFYQPQVRKIGNIVHIRGALTRTSSSDAQVFNISDDGFICILPDGFAPSKTENFVQQGSNNYRWTMQINSYGEIGLSRYSANGNAITVPKGHWLNLHCTYFLG